MLRERGWVYRTVDCRLELGGVRCTGRGGEGGRSGLNMVVDMFKGKKVRPLRDTWVTGCNTRAEWEEALKVLEQSNG